MSRSSALWCLVNCQKELPNIPIDAIQVRLRLGQEVKGVAQMAAGNEIVFRQRDGIVTFQLPRLETLMMLEIRVQP